MEQEAQAPVSIYSTPVMFMDKEASFDKDLANRPYDYKGRVCYATGFYVIAANGEKYQQVNTNHTGSPQNCFINLSRLNDKNGRSIPFEQAA